MINVTLCPTSLKKLLQIFLVDLSQNLMKCKISRKSIKGRHFYALHNTAVSTYWKSGRFYNVGSPCDTLYEMCLLRAKSCCKNAKHYSPAFPNCHTSTDTTFHFTSSLTWSGMNVTRRQNLVKSSITSTSLGHEESPLDTLWQVVWVALICKSSLHCFPLHWYPEWLLRH